MDIPVSGSPLNVVTFLIQERARALLLLRAVARYHMGSNSGNELEQLSESYGDQLTFIGESWPRINSATLLSATNREITIGVMERRANILRTIGNIADSQLLEKMFAAQQVAGNLVVEIPWDSLEEIIPTSDILYRLVPEYMMQKLESRIRLSLFQAFRDLALRMHDGKPAHVAHPSQALSAMPEGHQQLSHYLAELDPILLADCVQAADELIELETERVTEIDRMIEVSMSIVGADSFPTLVAAENRCHDINTRQQSTAKRAGLLTALTICRTTANEVASFVRTDTYYAEPFSVALYGGSPAHEPQRPPRHWGLPDVRAILKAARALHALRPRTFDASNSQPQEKPGPPSARGPQPDGRS